MIQLIECPRDAMQGIKYFIPTATKIEYINQLLRVGFDTIDFGSFVSPKAIPQMKDTARVLEGLNLDNSASNLLAIVANQRGARDAIQFDEIAYLGFPFSISETFQMRNTNSTIEESLLRVEEIQEICNKNSKSLVVYLSMGFGNPYGDEWNVEIVEKWARKLHDMGIRIMQLSDTIGIGNPDGIAYLFKNLIPLMPDVLFGAHLHTTHSTWTDKVIAAYENGCRRFDGALKGYGGCPMAKDDLTGNMATENMITYFSSINETLKIDLDELNKALLLARNVFAGTT